MNVSVFVFTSVSPRLPDTFTKTRSVTAPQEIGIFHFNRDHQPLAFLSGHFNRTKLGWSSVEKEAYGIMSCRKRMHWLPGTQDGFDLYTDHNNRFFIFHPHRIQSAISISSVKKVLRWEVRMSIYYYVTYHIKGSPSRKRIFLLRQSKELPFLRCPSSSAKRYQNECNKRYFRAT